MAAACAASIFLGSMKTLSLRSDDRFTLAKTRFTSQLLHAWPQTLRTNLQDPSKILSKNPPKRTMESYYYRPRTRPSRPNKQSALQLDWEKPLRISKCWPKPTNTVNTMTMKNLKRKLHQKKNGHVLFKVPIPLFLVGI